jgi:hypothetical protein
LQVGGLGLEGKLRLEAGQSGSKDNRFKMGGSPEVKQQDLWPREYPEQGCHNS